MKRERDEQKLDTDGIATKSEALKWFDNYWYHYKWITVGVVFALIVFIICTVQMCSKEKEDLIFVYAGRNQLSAAEADGICSAIEAACPEDFDKDGTVRFSISPYCILSAQQINEQKQEAKANGEELYFDNSYNSEQYSSYYKYLSLGESSVLFVDPWLYEELVSSDRLVSLEDALGTTPDGAYGKYGVRLGDTALYLQYGVMKRLPADTVICLMKPYVMGNSSKEEYYEREKKLFESVVFFGN